VRPAHINHQYFFMKFVHFHPMKALRLQTVRPQSFLHSCDKRIKFVRYAVFRSPGCVEIGRQFDGNQFLFASLESF
jgi:hypothetical protein